ncbi:unnamed protein product, partial [Ranitomeya imitator]
YNLLLPVISHYWGGDCRTGDHNLLLPVISHYWGSHYWGRSLQSITPCYQPLLAEPLLGEEPTIYYSLLSAITGGAITGGGDCRTGAYNLLLPVISHYSFDE